MLKQDFLSTIRDNTNRITVKGLTPITAEKLAAGICPKVPFQEKLALIKVALSRDKHKILTTGLENVDKYGVEESPIYDEILDKIIRKD